ncbi:translation elongation factor Ts [Blattabacterium cuenoti]|uniref:translation elongation factor Ts n=1 Tax=Blattabacterium cuenoti TaxID=1653831 RepID=UPI001EE9B232|nr:translation elongation factor Ts [Blattabacterium cuenoti]
MINSSNNMKKISIDKINELRKITGIGVMDCKEALKKTNGNIEDAVSFLRKKGKKISINHLSLEMKEGAVITAVNNDYSFGTIIGLSCETDFLSKSSIFLSLLSILSKKSLLYTNKEDFLTSLYNENTSIKEFITQKISVVKENIELKIFKRLESPFVIDYTHNNKISVLVGFSDKVNNLSCAKDIAMQIAAMNPISISKEDFPNFLVKKEIEIIKDQISKEGSYKKKPKNIIERIIKGKLDKFISENTLLNQKFIKKDKITIGNYLSKIDNKLKINSFKRISI